MESLNLNVCAVLVPYICTDSIGNQPSEDSIEVEQEEDGPVNIYVLVVSGNSNTQSLPQTMNLQGTGDQELQEVQPFQLVNKDRLQTERSSTN